MHKHPVYSAPQLGVLVVAGVFRELGWKVTLIDSNREYLHHLESGGKIEDFCELFCTRLAAHAPDLFGFSSICNSYYLTLSIAKLLKQKSSGSRILLGGPQASATAAATLDLCPEVDFVLCGEVDSSLREFVRYCDTAPERVPGLAYRRDGAPLVSAERVFPSIDKMAPAAYDLWDMSLAENIPIEGGRGCPFSCKFCSTSVFFGRSYRIKRPEQLIADVIELTARYGIEKVSFVHDNLFVSHRQCEDFCNAWLAERALARIRWSCSMRVGFVDEELAVLLSKANCDGVFIGIESGSMDIQRTIAKRIDVDQAVDMIRALARHGVHSTAAYIIGFPEESPDDFALTLETYAQTLRISHCKSQVSLLAVLPGTGYSIEDLTLDGAHSNISHQGPPLLPEHAAVVRSSPLVFSGHFAPRLRHLDPDRVAETEFVLNYSFSVFRWLFVFLTRSVEGGIVAVLNAWLSLAPRLKRGLDSRFAYYSSREFQIDFLRFCESPPVVSKLYATFLPLLRFLVEAYSQDEDYSKALKSAATQEGSGPAVLNPSVRIKVVSHSFSEIVAMLEGPELIVPPERSARIATYVRDNDLIVEELTPLASAILEAADRLPEQLAETCATLLPPALKGSRKAALNYCLRELSGKGLLHLDEAMTA